MANSQQMIIVGKADSQEYNNLLQEDGFRFITEDGLDFLALELGGGLTIHSAEIVAVISDYRITANLLGRVILTVDLENSQQNVLLSGRQIVNTEIANSSQTIRLKR